MSELRHASFFSGVGGLDLGFENAGIRTVSLCEIEPYASAVLAERFPGVPNFGDITKINDEEVPNAEVYSGGFPCQDLSASGARRGFADGTRSRLAFTFLDLVERRQPRWVVLENVPGLLTSNRGRDFGRLIHEMGSMGYGLAWRTLDAQWFGVAHKRRRIFIVAARDDAFNDLGGDRAAEVLVECEGACGHLATCESTGEKTPAARGGWVGERRSEHPEAHSDRMRTVDGVARRVDDRPGMAAATFSFPSRFGSNAQVTSDIAQSFAHSAGAPAVMRLREPDRFVDDDPLNPIGLDSNRYRCIGNGVVAPVAEFIGRRIVAVDAKYWKETNA
jgi:DNA (cytosine-5)-methyltransferase 1